MTPPRLLAARHGTYSLATPPPSGDFGGLLPARLPESQGSVTNVNTKTELENALNSVSNGSIINIASSINGGGSLLTITRVASISAPITVTRSPGVLLTNFSQINVRGYYLRFRGLDVGYATNDGFKFDSGSTGCEVDGCYVHDSARMGINFQSSSTGTQIWNSFVYNNGSTSNGNLDHGLYVGTTVGCVIANCVIYDNCNYNIQLYPNSPGTIVTCCVLDGQKSNPSYPRGGMVIGSEAGLEDNCRVVGILTTNAPGSGINIHNPGGDTGNEVYDSLGYGNGTDFVTNSSVTYTNCTHADPLYANRAAKNYRVSLGSPAIGKIDPARYGYVPPLDILGNPRITADAGAYAYGY